MLFVSVYLILLFHLIVVSFSSICVFISLCVASVALALVFMPGFYFIKKNQNAPRPSEHPPVMGEKCQNV